MKDNPISSAAPKLASDEELKAKYGKVYRIGVTVSEDDENEVELVYRFKRPSVASYDRYVKTLAQIGASKASKRFMLDAVVEEDEARLTADAETYPGVAIAIGGKLTDILGLTNTVNLKKL
ncbi:MAG: hypothetical protein KH704_07585 [Clostridiales bacterium]|nr:hypothetical protein [Clostridiales bacterium]